MIGIVVLFVGIVALSSRPRHGGSPSAARELTPAIVTPVATDSTVVAPVAKRPRAGRLVLDVGQGGFYIEPGRAGEGVHVEAKYDTSMYALREDLAETDSTWTYTLHMHRTASGLASLLQRLLHGGGDETELRIIVPPDMPVALDIDIKQGGFEGEIGGLWITSADITYAMGGFTLSVEEPLHEPMQSLTVRGSMGGFEGKNLGNASPRRVDIACSMGGAELDLSGLWLHDSDLRLEASMGGMEVHLPDGVRVEGLADPDSAGALHRSNAEVALPVLRFSGKSSMGGIEVTR
jgi:hypothetical protein